MRDRYLRFCPNLCLRPFVPPKNRRVKGHLTGDIRRHQFHSDIVGEREILVYLPPGYSDADTWTYPYAFLHDGQNVFDAESSVFGVEWGVDEAAELLIADQKIQPIILIAIYNSPDRVAEYTPFPDPEHGGGEAQRYAAFILTELVPFLDEKYLLTHRREERAVIGSSLGGLVSLYLGWYCRDFFGMVGALSPSLWWGRRAFITGMAGDPAPEVKPKIWLDAGTHEAESDINGNGVPDLIDDLRTMKAVLLYHGYEEGEDFIYKEVEGATHDEFSWSKRIGDVLTFFFSKENRLRY